MLDVLKEIKELTDFNDHAGAIVLGCEAIGAERLKEKAKHIQAIQTLDGYLHEGLNSYRRKIYNDMLKYAESTLNEDGYEKFYQCF